MRQLPLLCFLPRAAFSTSSCRLPLLFVSVPPSSSLHTTATIPGPLAQSSCQSLDGLDGLRLAGALQLHTMEV